MKFLTLGYIGSGNPAWYLILKIIETNSFKEFHLWSLGGGFFYKKEPQIHNFHLERGGRVVLSILDAGKIELTFEKQFPLLGFHHFDWNPSTVSWLAELLELSKDKF